MDKKNIILNAEKNIGRKIEQSEVDSITDLRKISNSQLQELRNIPHNVYSSPAAELSLLRVWVASPNSRQNRRVFPDFINDCVFDGNDPSRWMCEGYYIFNTDIKKLVTISYEDFMQLAYATGFTESYRRKPSDKDDWIRNASSCGMPMLRYTNFDYRSDNPDGFSRYDSYAPNDARLEKCDFTNIMYRRWIATQLARRAYKYTYTAQGYEESDERNEYFNIGDEITIIKKLLSEALVDEVSIDSIAAVRGLKAELKIGNDGVPGFIADDSCYG